MSKILFRGFHQCDDEEDKIFVNDEWVAGYWRIGYFYQAYDKTYILGELDDKSIDELEVIPQTVSQCTFITDTNDKVIFENDIITRRVIRDVYDENGEWDGHEWVNENDLIIDFADDSLYLKSAGFGYEGEGLCGGCSVRIVGNIFSTPGLFECDDQS